MFPISFISRNLFNKDQSCRVFFAFLFSYLPMNSSTETFNVLLGMQLILNTENRTAVKRSASNKSNSKLGHGKINRFFHH